MVTVVGTVSAQARTRFKKDKNRGSHKRPLVISICKTIRHCILPNSAPSEISQYEQTLTNSIHNTLEWDPVTCSNSEIGWERDWVRGKKKFYCKFTGTDLFFVPKNLKQSREQNISI